MSYLEEPVMFLACIQYLVQLKHCILLSKERDFSQLRNHPGRNRYGIEVCRKGNRWWYSFNCSSQPRLYHISWISRNLELGNYLMDLRLGNVCCAKSQGVKGGVLVSERFCWKWVNSACGELNWGHPQGTAPNPARTGSASSVWAFFLQGSSFY